MKVKRLNYQIEMQGKIAVYECILYRKCKSLCLVFISTDYRYPDIIGYGSDENDIPSISLATNDENDETLTSIEFPTFKGWRFVCASDDKESVFACLEKRQ